MGTNESKTTVYDGGTEDKDPVWCSQGHTRGLNADEDKRWFSQRAGDRWLKSGVEFNTGLNYGDGLKAIDKLPTAIGARQFISEIGGPTAGGEFEP